MSDTQETTTIAVRNVNKAAWKRAKAAAAKADLKMGPWLIETIELRLRGGK